MRARWTKASLEIEPEKIARRLVFALRTYARKSKARGGVVGLSGGVDSSVAIALAVKAFGKQNVVGLSMPGGEVGSSQDVRDARDFAVKLGCRFYTVDIGGLLSAFKRLVPVYEPQDRLSNGNLKPRIRMLTLYYFANRLNYLVIGTSNKSEILTGYFTKYGDGASDVVPLGELYKTQVYQLAKHVRVPLKIIGKKPTAGLWPGQYDEDEIGVAYSLLDLALLGLGKGMKPSEVQTAIGLSRQEISRIMQLRKSSEHKRIGPVSLV
ncbi:MAG: NAD+ synthase [Candidatus Bathyarchaeia archaeon]